MNRYIRKCVQLKSAKDTKPSLILITDLGKMLEVFAKIPHITRSCDAVVMVADTKHINTAVYDSFAKCMKLVLSAEGIKCMRMKIVDHVKFIP